MGVPTFKVDADWHCQRSGDCCTLPDYVVMTVEEQAVINDFAEHNLPISRLNRINFDPWRPGFVALIAHPCPLHEFIDGRSTCLVHPVRPYNCRRFACLRPDPHTEPLQLTPLSPVLRYGLVGCANTRKRLIQSRAARRLFDTIQRRAKRWAITHGWKENADDVH